MPGRLTGLPCWLSQATTDSPKSIKWCRLVDGLITCYCKKKPVITGSTTKGLGIVTDLEIPNPARPQTRFSTMKDAYRIEFWNFGTINPDTQLGQINIVMKTLDKYRIDMAALSETRNSTVWDP